MSRSGEGMRSNWQVDAAGIGVVVVVTLIAVIVGFKPVVEKRLARSDQKRQLTEQREEVESLTATLGRMRSQLVRVEQAIEQSELRLEPVRQLNRRVAELAELAGACELSVDVIQPGAARSGQRYEFVPIQLGGTAEYARCARFLRELSRQFPDVAVTAMELDAQPGDAERVARFRFMLSWHAAPAMTANAAGGER